MPKKLAVSAVRESIYRAVHPNGDPAHETSNVLLGRLFHELAEALTDPECPANFEAAIAETDPSREEWKTRLVQHAYQQLVGPQLAREQARLQGAGEQTLAYWQACREFCDWLAGVLWTARPAEPAKSAKGRSQMSPTTIFQPELPMSCTIRQNGWTDEVRLVGIADLLVCRPHDNRYCVVELKLGRGLPELDALQACLYHLILSAAGQDGEIALVSFTPKRKERLIDAERIRQTRDKLLQLIGRLAGAMPEGSPPPVPQPTILRQHRDLGKQLVDTFGEFNVSIELDGEPTIGPTFLRHPICLGKGVKINAVKRLADDVRLRLGLESVPFIHIAGGRAVVDIQRPDRQTVPFSQVRGQLDKMGKMGCSRLPVGVDLDGQLLLADLAEPDNAHILVAGTTGSGKSEWLRSALAGLIATNTPETLQLVLIDPKRNAFSDLGGSPFLRGGSVIYPGDQSVDEVLSNLVDAMEYRYVKLAQVGADDLNSYVTLTGEALPRIVCVCDEYADLIARGSEERKALEKHVFRLGAKARAAGIHLIFATQRPSRDVVKGALDANMPARVGLRTERAIESTMLLGCAGAERLLGKGDLLFKSIGEPLRLQSPYLPPGERAAMFGGQPG